MTSITTETTTTPLHIVTMGDSTIDNLIWMDKSPQTNQFHIADCVIGQLRHQLPTNTVVTNLAADGFTSDNVLHGAMPMLSRVAWKRAGEPFPSDAHVDGVLSPLLELEKLCQQKKSTTTQVTIPPVTHVLLSVGGNDVRVILQSMHNLPEVVAIFHSNYNKICERILAIDPNIKLIIMLQYQVCLTHEEGGYGKKIFKPFIPDIISIPSFIHY